MKIAAGAKFIESFGGKVQVVYPEAEWIVYEPQGTWSSPPDEMDIAVLIGDAYCTFFKEAVLNAPRLRWVHTENSGIDDLFYRKLLDRGIPLTTSPGANAPEVVEFVFGLLLRTVKRLDGFQQNQTQHRWLRLEMESLSDKTMLIVGLGAIGSKVATVAKAFGIHVLGIRKTDRITAGVDELGTPVDLEHFLSRADIVVLALPFSPLTRNLLSDRQFQAMREKSILINIARGGIVDTEALKRALSAKPSMRACLDVLPCEPLSGEDELWNFPNLFITPHVAWCSPLFRPRAAMIWLNNLARMRDGIPLMHLANQEDVHC